jgi:hypothetical protein
MTMTRFFVGLLAVGCLAALVVLGSVYNRRAEDYPTYYPPPEGVPARESNDRCPVCGGPRGECTQGPAGIMPGCSGNGFKPPVQGVGPGTYQPKPWELDRCRPGYTPTAEDERRNEDLRKRYESGRTERQWRPRP